MVDARRRGAHARASDRGCFAISKDRKPRGPVRGCRYRQRCRVHASKRVIGPRRPGRVIHFARYCDAFAGYLEASRAMAHAHTSRRPAGDSCASNTRRSRNSVASRHVPRHRDARQHLPSTRWSLVSGRRVTCICASSWRSLISTAMSRPDTMPFLRQPRLLVVTIAAAFTFGVLCASTVDPAHAMPITASTTSSRCPTSRRSSPTWLHGGQHQRQRHAHSLHDRRR